MNGLVPLPVATKYIEQALINFVRLVTKSGTMPQTLQQVKLPFRCGSGKQPSSLGWCLNVLGKRDNMEWNPAFRESVQRVVFQAGLPLISQFVRISLSVISRHNRPQPSPHFIIAQDLRRIHQ